MREELTGMQEEMEFYFREESEDRAVEEPMKRFLWFQTQVETKEGFLSLSVFNSAVSAELFEIEIARNAAYETKIFICTSMEKVLELHALILKDAEVYFHSLSRTGWVKPTGERYHFKIGDRIICQGRQIFELASPLNAGENVLLLDKKGLIVNQCSAEYLNRCLIGEENERFLAVKRDVETGDLIYTRVLKLEKRAA